MKYAILTAALLTGCAQTEPIKFGIHQIGEKKVLVVEQRGMCNENTGCAIQWADKVDAVWQINYSVPMTRGHELDHVHGMKHSVPWVPFTIHTKTGMQTVHCVLVTDPGTTKWKMNELMCADAEGYYPSHDGRRNFDGGAK